MEKKQQSAHKDEIQLGCTESLFNIKNREAVCLLYQNGIQWPAAPISLSAPHQVISIADLKQSLPEEKQIYAFEVTRLVFKTG